MAREEERTVGTQDQVLTRPAAGPPVPPSPCPPLPHPSAIDAPSATAPPPPPPPSAPSTAPALVSFKTPQRLLRDPVAHHPSTAVDDDRRGGRPRAVSRSGAGRDTSPAVWPTIGVRPKPGHDAAHLVHHEGQAGLQGCPGALEGGPSMPAGALPLTPTRRPAPRPAPPPRRCRRLEGSTTEHELVVPFHAVIVVKAPLPRRPEPHSTGEGGPVDLLSPNGRGGINGKQLGPTGWVCTKCGGQSWALSRESATPHAPQPRVATRAFRHPPLSPPPPALSSTRSHRAGWTPWARRRRR
jgi:hypothetical protein